MKILEDICNQYGLGALECPPVQLKGGFLHKMYALCTEKGQVCGKTAESSYHAEKYSNGELPPGGGIGTAVGKKPSPHHPCAAV